jgi:hypothetical protein
MQQWLRDNALKLLTLLAFLSLSAEASAQAVRSDANCTYQTCALGLAPVWNGLAVTRGSEQREVAVLGFLFPTDISRTFEADREALDAAADAVRVRSVAAALTDGGIVLAATGIARALFRRDWDKLSTALTVAGGGALGASVPFQFAADGHLSRAVWLFNRRYAK